MHSLNGNIQITVCYGEKKRWKLELQLRNKLYWFRIREAVTCTENKEKNWKEDIFLSAMYKKPTWTRIVYKQKSIACHNFQKFQTKIYYLVGPGTAQNGQNVMLTKRYYI